MERAFVSQEELLNWMNSQIAEYEECTDCRFDAVVQLKEEDEDQCNWSDPNLRCSGAHIEVCWPIAQRVYEHARTQFNVEWPEEA